MASCVGELWRENRYPVREAGGRPAGPDGFGPSPLVGERLHVGEGGRESSSSVPSSREV